MSLNRSLGEILESLERGIAQHREQASAHAKQEEHHRGRRVFHEGRLETLTRQLDSLRTLAVPFAEGVAAESMGLEGLNPKPEPAGLHRKSKVGKLIARILDALPDGETFGPVRMAAEIDRRYLDLRGRPADVRNVSAVLRRLHRQNRIRLVSPGTPHHEAVYSAQSRQRQRPEEPELESS